MKKGLMLMSLAILLTAACDKGRSDVETVMLDSETVTATLLWEKIQNEDYSKWDMLPGHPEMEPGVAPHGPLHSIYVNEELMSGLPAEGALPYGSVVVKENYMEDETLAAYTVMAKVEGYNPTAGDWFWAKYNADGTIAADGIVPMCIECHGGNAQNDYIMIYTIDDEL